MTFFEYDLTASEEDGDFYSDAVATLAYDRDTKRLYVEFHSGGEYVYEGVEESTYNLFVDADSKGGFFRSYIQGKYDRAEGTFYGITEKEKDKDPQPETFDLSDDGAGEVPTVEAGRYGVKWSNGTLTMEPEFQALSEADALVQFQAAMDTAAAVGFVTEDTKVQIVSVTHYFD